MKVESNLAKVLSQDKLAVTTQLSFPAGTSIEQIRKKASKFKDFTAVFAGNENQPDINLTSLAVSLILKEEGVEPVLQVNSRDKNRIALQKEILSASAMGIKNIFVQSGIHPASDKELGAKAVYDLDPLNLVSLMKNMRDEGRLLNGNTIIEKPEIFIGIEDNPIGEPFEAMPIFLGKKVKAGADFILTHPVFDMDKFEKFMEQLEESSKNVNIIATIYLLRSFEEAENFKLYYPGTFISPSILDRLKGASDVEQEGMDIFVEFIDRLKNMKEVKGLNLISKDQEELIHKTVLDVGLI